MIRCVVIDDEVSARNGIGEYISGVPFLKLDGTFDNPLKSLDIIQKIDLMFLDIQMPGIDGLSFLRSLKDPPIVILTTAFPEFALEGYQLQVFDYLVKPFPFERFLTSVTKAKVYLQRNRKIEYDDFLFLKTDKGFERVETSEIIYIEGLQNYVSIQCQKRQILLYTTMKGIESFLNHEIFLRAQKSFIVNVDKVNRIFKDELIMVNEKIIPISKKNKDEIIEKLLRDRLFKR